MRRLPPLHALRAFEAAARHLSFKLAAAELHVTPAAISHQIKALEGELGIRLFHRMTREIRLSEEGHALAPGLREGFDRLAGAVERVAHAPARTTFALSAMTTITMAWLVPRLPRFQARHPDIEVRVTSSNKLVDFAREEFDGALRHGTGGWRGLAQHKLFEHLLTPFVTPELAGRLRRPADLAGMPLLHAEGDNEWEVWLAAAGLERMPPKRGPTFDSTRICLEAATRGLGVAIADPMMNADLIATGALVQPFDIVASTGRAYWFVYPQPFAERPKIVAFRRWLEDEVRDYLKRPASSPRAGSRSGRAAAAARRSAKAARAPGRDGGSGD